MSYAINSYAISVIACDKREALVQGSVSDEAIDSRFVIPDGAKRRSGISRLWVRDRPMRDRASEVRQIPSNDGVAL